MENFEKNNTYEKEVNPEIAKEKEMTPEAKAAATMERADLLIKEVKSSKQQIQNIMMNMTHVMQAIQALRQQLQLASNGEDVVSVEQDKKMIEKLKKKIAGHTNEILKMKEELIEIQAKQMNEANGGEVTEDLKQKAKEMVENLISQISS